MNTSPGSSSIENMAGWEGLLRHNVKVLTTILGAKKTYEMSEQIYDELLKERAAPTGDGRKRKNPPAVLDGGALRGEVDETGDPSDAEETKVVIEPSDSDSD